MRATSMQLRLLRGSSAVALLVAGCAPPVGPAPESKPPEPPPPASSVALPPATAAPALASSAPAPPTPPAPTRVLKVVAGEAHTCVLLDTGVVRCWGTDEDGRTGKTHEPPRGGPHPLPDTKRDLDMGGKVVDLAAGNRYTCAILEGGNVRCWGFLYDSSKTPGQVARLRGAGGWEPAVLG